MKSIVGNLWEAAWRRSYLRGLRRELRNATPGSEDEVLGRIKVEARRTLDRRRSEIPDPQGLMVISTCSLILATYRELIARDVAKEQAFEIIQRAFQAVFAAPMDQATRLLMWLLPDPVATMRRRSISPLFATLFGRLFDFGEEHTNNGVLLTITRCGFNNFFVQEGEPQLTRVMCGWDRNWLRPIDRSNRPIATRRTQTLSTGAHHCEFHFDKAPPKPGQPIDVIFDKRQVES